MKQITELGHDSEKIDIFRRAQMLNNLNQKIQPCLPAEFIGKVNVANYRQGSLILAVENAGIATQLRYIISDLLSTLRRDAKLYDLANIQFYIQPPEEQRKKTQEKMGISSQAAQNIKDIANGLPDSPVKEALIRLSERELL